MSLIYRKNDQLPSPQVTFTRGGTAIDLSGATAVRGHVKIKGQSTIKVTRSLTPVDAANGIFRLDWQSGDLNTVAAIYQVELEIEWTAGVYETAPDLLEFAVVEDFST
ncbi:MAG: hypothetical protein P1S46_06275 [bacterium]|nr:hypothetical protein [bacterium]